jgi:hypothetical protein
MKVNTMPKRKTLPKPGDLETAMEELGRLTSSLGQFLYETPYARLCKDLGNSTAVEVQDWPRLTQAQSSFVAALLERPEPLLVERLHFPRYIVGANEYLVRHAMETGALARDFGPTHLVLYAVEHHVTLTAEGRRVLMDANGAALAESKKTAAGQKGKPTGGGKRPGKGGRQSDPERVKSDKRIFNAHNTGTSYDVLATEHGRTKGDIIRAYDRARKREERRTQ